MRPVMQERNYGDPNRPGFADCTGCNICVLPCPVWRQTHDRSLTLAGRAKALQRGIPVEALAASLEACVLCGACEPVCPVNIDTVGMTIDLRARLAADGNSALAKAAAKMPAFEMIAMGIGSHSAVETRHVASKTLAPRGSEEETDRWRLAAPASSVASLQRGNAPPMRTWFLPGRALRAESAPLKIIGELFRVRKIAQITVDDGADLAVALEAGLPIDPARKAKFLASLKGARELIVGDGLLHRYLREWLPSAKIIGIGEALLRLASARSALKAGDLYVIETRGYHADFARLVRLYDGLRQEIGCAMNLDLQRAAIPTGAGSLQNLLGLKNLDLAKQSRWVIEGRKIERIVIEDAADLAIFAKISPLPVVHLAELADAAG